MSRPGPGKCASAACHRKGCRLGRPLCRWRRAQAKEKYGVCRCDAYHFPHRGGSRACAAGVFYRLLPAPGQVDHLNDWTTLSA